MSTEYRCGMCGRACEHNEEMFLEPSTKTYLDFIPQNNPLDYISSYLEFCPACGLVGHRINEKLDSATRHQILDVICLKEYNDIVCKSSMNTIEKKIILASIFNRELGWFHKINYYAFAYYDIMGQPDKAKQYALKEIARLQQETNAIMNAENQDQQMKLYSTIYDHYVMAELYRRLSMFDDALDVIKKYDRFTFRYYNDSFKFIGANYKKFFSIQKHLCETKNNERK